MSAFFSDSRYVQAIKATKKIAQEDYRIVDEELKPVQRALQDLQTALKGRLDQIESAVLSKRVGKTQKEALSSLKEIYQRLTDARAIDLDELRTNLRSKKKSIGNFTLVMMGRTKAGKSTLFATLLDTGYDGIGSGQQRTTRENKSYDLANGIRLVDTPGIAAVGGEQDEAEALKAVQEADLICYIVTNDSVQEAEFDFLRKLKNQKKPLIILLNIQNNLQDERRLNRFLKKPNKLMSSTEIEEHKKRIFRYAREHYQNDSITIIPVMLLAAQLSQYQENPELSEKLYKASQIQNFLDYVSDAIEKYGTLLASHLMLRETAVSLQNQASHINAEIQICREIEEQLEKKKQEFLNRLDKIGREIEKRIETEVRVIFQPAINQVPNFARQHWDKNEERQREYWKRFIEEKQNFDQKLQNLSERIQSDYRRKIQDILDEISQDLQFEAQSRNSSRYSGTNPGFDFKILFDFGAALAGLLMFIPGVGLVAGLFAGAALSMIGKFFDSNEKRRDKAVKKIEDILRGILESQQDKMIDSYKNNVSKIDKKIKKSVSEHFAGINKELNHIYQTLKITENTMQSKNHHILKFFGLRALHWCQNRTENFKMYQIDQVLGIDDTNQDLVIQVKDMTLPFPENVNQCNQFLGENITFWES